MGIKPDICSVNLHTIIHLQWLMLQGRNNSKFSEIIVAAMRKQRSILTAMIQGGEALDSASDLVTWSDRIWSPGGWNYETNARRCWLFK